MFRDLLAHIHTNPSGGGGARFLRLLSYFATFALVIGTFLPFMSKLAYSEGTLSYEIRATFITSDPSSDNLKIKIKEDPQAEISQAGAGDSEEDGDVGDVQEINSKYSKCRVVFTVTSSNSSLYTAGKKITCVCGLLQTARQTILKTAAKR